MLFPEDKLSGQLCTDDKTFFFVCFFQAWQCKGLSSFRIGKKLSIKKRVCVLHIC